jgi:hypothetical protein
MGRFFLLLLLRKKMREAYEYNPPTPAMVNVKGDEKGVFRCLLPD